MLTAQQQTALSVLEQLYEVAKDLRDQGVRIRSQARIADALWEYDRPRARRYFADAFGATRAVAAFAEGSNPVGLDSRKLDLREEILALIARRDRQLAEDLLRAAGEGAAGESQGPSRPAQALHPDFAPLGSQSEQATLYLRQAINAADADPEHAARMVRSSLGAGINFMLSRALLAIRGKNPALADKLFGEALALARRDAARSVVNARLLSGYVLLGEGGGEGAGAPAARRISPELVRQYLGFAYQALTSRDDATAAAPEDDGGETHKKSPGKKSAALFKKLKLTSLLVTTLAAGGPSQEPLIRAASWDARDGVAGRQRRRAD